MRRLLLDSTSVVRSSFFHMVGRDPGFICLRWLGSKALVKQLSSKWTEQITKRVFGSGWKFFLFVLTNRAHASLVFLSFGLACSAIPAARLVPLLQSWTTQRLPTIESAKNNPQNENSSWSKWAKSYEKLAMWALTWENDITRSFPRNLTDLASVVMGNHRPLVTRPMEHNSSMADQNEWSLSAKNYHFPSSYEDMLWKSCTLGRKLPIKRIWKVFGIWS